MECRKLLWLIAFPILQTTWFYAVDVASHPCERPCDGNSMICNYTLTIDMTSTMGGWCRDCPNTPDDCNLPNCIPANGIFREITPINRALPGPFIQVCQGDTISAKVINKLQADTIVIHWHGMVQNGTNQYDGVPMLTQCPIPPGNSFLYEFKADPAGTCLYHSHTAESFGDGIFGVIVVRQQNDPMKAYYDEDRFDHVVQFNTWTEALGIKLLTQPVTPTSTPAFTSGQQQQRARISMLVCGKGREQPRDNVAQPKTPVKKFMVDRGVRYRFRFVNTATMGCPIEVKIDNIKLTVICADIGCFEPVTVDAISMNTGERFDAVIMIPQNQSGSSFAMHFRAIEECNMTQSYDQTVQTAFLQVNGEPDTSESILDGTTFSTINTQFSSGGSILNPGGSNSPDANSMGDLKAIQQHRDPKVLTQTCANQFYLVSDFVSPDMKDPAFAARPESELIVDGSGSALGSLGIKVIGFTSFDYYSLIFPNAPPLFELTESNVDKIYCDGLTSSNTSYTPCFRQIAVPLFQCVELVLINRNTMFSHPFHLHGHPFYVVTYVQYPNGPFDSVITKKKIQDDDAAGKIKRNLVNPILKDTVNILSNGLTIIRFYTDNPGYWLFHCHITSHMLMGMGGVVKAGDQSQFSVPKDGFPKCGNYPMGS